MGLKLVVNNEEKKHDNLVEWLCMKCGFHRWVMLTDLIKVNHCPRCGRHE